MATSDIRDILFIIAPEFYTVDTTELSNINTIIGLASNRINRTRWGAKADEGTAWLTAHLLKRSEMATAGQTGNIIKEKLADQEITYSDYSRSGNFDNFYSSTIYGQEYINLLKTITSTPLLWGQNCV